MVVAIADGCVRGPCVRGERMTARHDKSANDARHSLVPLRKEKPT
jgi:hypothetical protein